MSNVLVCGRGESLNTIGELKGDYDCVILLNEFNRFSRESPQIAEFLQGKKIIQFLNITEGGLDQEFINYFNIRDVYVTRLGPDGKDFASWWRQPRHHRVPESFGIQCRYQPPELEPYMHIVENSSDVALLFSLLSLNAKNIDIIGVDFYEAEYFLGHSEPDIQDEDDTKRIMGAHKKIVSLFPETNFRYYTRSSFDAEKENCVSVRV